MANRKILCVEKGILEDFQCLNVVGSVHVVVTVWGYAQFLSH